MPPRSARPLHSCFRKRARALPARRSSSIAATTSWGFERGTGALACARFVVASKESRTAKIGCATKMPKLTITIDGPAGSGKSSVARRVAATLGYLYLDSGAMYRALALKAVRRRISLLDEPKLEALAKETHIELRPPRPEQEAAGAENCGFFDGLDIHQ